AASSSLRYRGAVGFVLETAAWDATRAAQPSYARCAWSSLRIRACCTCAHEGFAWKARSSPRIREPVSASHRTESAKRVQVGRDVARGLLGDTQVRHGGAGLDRLRCLDPADEHPGCVGHFTGDVGASRPVLQRRSDETLRLLDARDHVACAASDPFDVGCAAFSVGAGDRCGRLGGARGLMARRRDRGGGRDDCEREHSAGSGRDGTFISTHHSSQWAARYGTCGAAWCFAFAVDVAAGPLGTGGSCDWCPPGLGSPRVWLMAQMYAATRRTCSSLRSDLPPRGGIAIGLRVNSWGMPDVISESIDFHSGCAQLRPAVSASPAAGMPSASCPWQAKQLP